jgi:hypothetical protein
MAMLQIACLLLPPALQAWLGRPPPPLRARLALLRMSTPAVGSPLPLPPALSSLEGVPGSVGSLEELADGRELLVLCAAGEASMGDRLRQTLVGLQEVAASHDAQPAAVSLVGAATYRKLVRKAGVSYPLLSDPGRAWLNPLGGGGGGASSAGPVVVFVVSVRSAAVLACFGEDAGSVPQVLEAVGTALAKGRAGLEAEAAEAVGAARQAAEVAALKAENERLRRERQPVERAARPV